MTFEWAEHIRKHSHYTKLGSAPCRVRFNLITSVKTQRYTGYKFDVFPTGEWNHRCPECDLAFRDAITMERHRKRAHLGRDAGDDDDTWRTLLHRTDQPGGDTVGAPDDAAVVAMLTELESADRHADASDQVPVQCSICGKIELLLSSLFKHVRDRHSANPRYGDALKRVHDIRLERRNTLECWLCGEQCQGQQLYKHIRVMHGDNPDFSELMKKARLVYRQSRPRRPLSPRAQCAHCHRFFTKNYVNAHFEICRRRGAVSAAATRMRCEICNEQFASGQARCEHRRSVHRLLVGGNPVPYEKKKAKARLRNEMIKKAATGKSSRYFVFSLCFSDEALKARAGTNTPSDEYDTYREYTVANTIR